MVLSGLSSFVGPIRFDGDMEVEGRVPRMYRNRVTKRCTFQLPTKMLSNLRCGWPLSRPGDRRLLGNRGKAVGWILVDDAATRIETHHIAP